ncbi:hypothetical protein NQ317_010623 [Molorchus minor]|uniref:Uncharacterized protein n=1 Tax=Molorchus minor TaxID=1323400 RepID=A0ABQ9JC12_9CUCU|nr:hypothetical protein NQ317_010623 [Molorchus minor]
MDGELALQISGKHVRIHQRLAALTHAALDFSWASLAALASSSSYLLQLYQELPCGSHGPRHTQQKSALQFWFLHTMWLQPPSFSMVALHLGHSFVLAAIQLDVSESSSHFFCHFLSRAHLTGSCQFSPQAKQKTWLHLHATGFDSTGYLNNGVDFFDAIDHVLDYVIGGQHLILVLVIVALQLPVRGRVHVYGEVYVVAACLIA